MIRMIRNVALAASLSLGFAASHVQAAFAGSLALAAISPSTDTGSLDGASVYTVMSLFTTAAGTGQFSTVPGGTTYSGGSFTVGSPTGFTFSNATYGTFIEGAAPILESQTVVNGHVVAEDFYILGTYVGGPVGATAVPASFDISFTQNGGPGESISASGTLVIPPTTIAPEPASVVMLGLGLAGFCGYGLRRRMAK